MKRACGRTRVKQHWKQIVTALTGLTLALILMVPAAMAIAPTAFSGERPADHVIDDADVFSRASRGELETRLKEFEQDRLDARLITLRRLDYGYTLNSFGKELLEQWTETGEAPLMLVLIESQGKRAAIVADASLQSRLPEALLKSTARTTMAIPLREGDRYRQASVDGLGRISVVLNGGEDPGPPEETVRTTLPTNIPTQEETQSSNATTWIIVLMLLGTIIPMATWWVFSR